MTTSEQMIQWIAKCALNDKKAFESIYRETSPKIYAVLLRLLKNQVLAEEALQETFIHLWKNAASYNNEKGEPQAWIMGIARYRALDIQRKKKNQLKYEELYSHEKSITSTTSHPLHAQDTELSQCLERLKPKAKDSIIMAYCEGYTHEELSHYLTTPIGTVKSWIRRGLKNLQECMHELSKP